MKCEIPVRHAIKSIYAAIQVAHINSQFQIIIDISRRTAITKNNLLSCQYTNMYSMYRYTFHENQTTNKLYNKVQKQSTRNESKIIIRPQLTIPHVTSPQHHHHHHHHHPTV